MYIQRERWRLNRRTFLRAAGVSLALPWLEAMGLRSGSVTNAGEITGSEIPRRTYFAIWGFFNNRAVPRDTGKNYTLTPPFDVLQKHKNDFTLFSGMQVFSGSHNGPGSFLTGKNDPTNNLRLISVDQQIAAFHKGETRVPSLVLANVRSTGFGGVRWSTPSWTANRTPIAPENRPEVVFDQLFRVDDPKTRAAAGNRLNQKASVLHLLKNQAEQLKKKLGKDDRTTVEQYFTSIENVENRINIDREWADRPKPDLKKLQVAPLDFGKMVPVAAQAEANEDGTEMKRYLRLFFDVIALAFQTDSTRVIAHFPKGEGGSTFKDVTKCPYHYHVLSHHGEDKEKLEMWTAVDRVYLEQWAYFLDRLQSIKEGQGTLLDHTMAAWVPTAGEAGHAVNNLPLMLCGGAGLGLKHQGHVVKKDMWVGSVWQTMLDRLGMPLPENFQAGLYDGVIKEVV
jgi:hypothetical protein